jgi:hypothetical protein
MKRVGENDMGYYNVTFVGLYFSLTCQVSFFDCDGDEDNAIQLADKLMLDTYAWQVQACSHEVIVEVEGEN